MSQSPSDSELFEEKPVSERTYDTSNDIMSLIRELQIDLQTRTTAVNLARSLYPESDTKITPEDLIADANQIEMYLIQGKNTNGLT